MNLLKPINYKNIKKITDLEFHEILFDCGVRDNFCVAVSGGPDSLALYFLAKKYAQKNNYHFSVITVDHKLRKDSTKEVNWLRDLFKKDNTKYHILRWNGLKPKSNLMALARNKRYELINSKCVELGAKYLLTAHHLDDQIETFFMRLVRGSGIKGLSSITRKSKMKKMILIRPLLDYSKKSLIKILAEKKQYYIEDPTNKNISFDRIRYRKIISSLIDEGIDKYRLNKLISNLSQANIAVDYLSKTELKNCLSQNKYGHIQIKKEIFFNLPREVQFRILNFLIFNYSNQEKKVRSNAILKLLENLNKNNFKSLTLNNILFLNNKSHIILVRETSRINKKNPISDKTFFWDNFYEVNIITKKNKNLKIGYLGNKIILPKKYTPFKNITPYLPAIWKNDKLLSIPQLDNKKIQSVTCKPIKLSQFIKSYNLSL